MSGPWEKYQKPAETQAEGPWSKFQAPEPAAPVAEDDGFMPTQYGFKVRPINAGNVQTVQREDGGVWFGPEQGNKGKPGWFDASGMRLGDAPGKPPSFMDQQINDLQRLGQEDRQKSFVAGLVPRQVGGLTGGLVKGGMAAAQLGAHALGSSALDRPVEQYNQFQRENFGEQPVMEAIGQAAPFVTSGGSSAAPQALSSMQKVRAALAAIGKAGVTGAVAAPALTGEEGVKDSGDFFARKLAEAKLGGGVGLALGAGGQMAGPLSRVGTRLKAALTPGTTLAPEAQAIQDLGEQFGVRTMAPDLTASPGLNKAAVLAESVPGSGMVSQRLAQQAEAKAAAEKLLAQHGIEGDAATKIQQGLQNRLASAKASAKAAYDHVSQLAKGKGDVPLDETLKAIQQFKAQEAAAVVPDQGLIGLLDKMEGRITDPKAGVDLSYNGVRGLRSDLGSMISDYYKGTNAATGSKGVQVLQGVKGAIEGDLNAFTTKNGPEIAAAAKRADAIYKGEVVPFKDRALASALKSSEPDQIYRTFIQQGKGDRAQKFYNALDPEGQAAVRSQMVQDAFNKATERDGVFSPAKFAQSLEKVKDASGVFFKGQDKFELDGFTNLMRHIQRAGQVAENPTNGQRLVQMLIAGEGVGSVTGAMMGHPSALVLPATSVASARAMTKLFSSQAGKRFLLSASTLKAGTPAMEQIIEKDLPKILAPSTAKGIPALQALPGTADASNPDTIAQH